MFQISLFDRYKAMATTHPNMTLAEAANESDAERRDRGWALAMERGTAIQEMLPALKAAIAFVEETGLTAETEALSNKLFAAVRRGEKA